MANMSWNTKYQNSTGFNCSTQTTQSNFGVNPNYRLGMVQVYNLGIQRTLPQGTVLNIDYTGAYATNQDIVRTPNRNAQASSTPLRDSSVTRIRSASSAPTRSPSTCASACTRASRLAATYTYSHSIDDASSVGGSGGGPSRRTTRTSAPRRATPASTGVTSLSGNFVIEPPFGPNRAFLNKGGVFAKVLDGYSISGNYTFASGTYAYAAVSAELQRKIKLGANYLRPNRNFTRPIKGAGTRLSWFNTAAFVAACPANPPFCEAPGTYGTASRNSIQLPGTVSISGSLSRTITFGGTRSFEARINANNALNTVQYSGVSTSGQLADLWSGHRSGRHEVVHILGLLQVLNTFVVVTDYGISSGGDGDATSDGGGFGGRNGGFTGRCAVDSLGAAAGL